MTGRQWLLREGIERGGGKLAAVECGQQIGFDQVIATTDIDQVRAARQLGEQRRVQETMRLGRERQQAHQRVAARQEFIELVVTVKTGHAGRQVSLGAATPAPHRIADGGQRFGASQPQRAEPGDAHAMAARRHHRLFLPPRCGRTGDIGRHATVLLHHGPADVSLHSSGHGGVDDATQRQMARQIGIGHEVIDARRQRLYELQIGQSGELPVNRKPAHGHVDVRQIAQVRPHAQVDAGRHRRKGVRQGSQVQALAQEGDAGRIFVHVFCLYQVGIMGEGAMTHGDQPVAPFTPAHLSAPSPSAPPRCHPEFPSKPITGEV